MALMAPGDMIAEEERRLNLSSRGSQAEGNSQLPGGGTQTTCLCPSSSSPQNRDWLRSPLAVSKQDDSLLTHCIWDREKPRLPALVRVGFLSLCSLVLQWLNGSKARARFYSFSNA